MHNLGGKQRMERSVMKSDLNALLSVKCPGCGTADGIEWHAGIRTPSYIVDGRLRASEITPIFFAGCEFCSETIKTIDACELALMMTERDR